MNNTRKEEINAYIQERGEVRLEELLKLFPGVSAMTIRRDLDALEQDYEIVRTRGGAKSIAFLSNRTKEEEYIKKVETNMKEKNCIAKKAVSLIKPNSSVFLDAGSTVMSLAKMIPNEKYHIFTNAPNVAMEVLSRKQSFVHLTGGEINRENLSVSGAGSVEFMKNINIDIAFVAASGFSFNNGFSCGNINDLQLKKVIIERAATVVMLMDSSKIGRNMPYTFARLSDIDILPSDGKLPQKFIEQAADEGVKIL